MATATVQQFFFDCILQHYSLSCFKRAESRQWPFWTEYNPIVDASVSTVKANQTSIKKIFENEKGKDEDE